MRPMLIIFGTIYLMDISPMLVKFQLYRLNTCKMTGKFKKISMHQTHELFCLFVA
jgi:hypothetical protein